MSAKDYNEVMSERPSTRIQFNYRYENKEYLVEVMMKQLGITETDLENDPSWMKAKVRLIIDDCGEWKLIPSVFFMTKEEEREFKLNKILSKKRIHS